MGLVKYLPRVARPAFEGWLKHNAHKGVEYKPQSWWTQVDVDHCAISCLRFFKGKRTRSGAALKGLLDWDNWCVTKLLVKHNSENKWVTNHIINYLVLPFGVPVDKFMATIKEAGKVSFQVRDKLCMHIAWAR